MTQTDVFVARNHLYSLTNFKLGSEVSLAAVCGRWQYQMCITGEGRMKSIQWALSQNLNVARDSNIPPIFPFFNRKDLRLQPDGVASTICHVPSTVLFGSFRVRFFFYRHEFLCHETLAQIVVWEADSLPIEPVSAPSTKDMLCGPSRHDTFSVIFGGPCPLQAPLFTRQMFLP